MAQSLAQTAIAFLIDLAERGEIDPWNVKVIDVIDRFLDTLRQEAPESKHGRSPYEASLSESGQAFLYASMLVLLKADTLVRAELEAEAEEELEPEELFEGDDPSETELPRNLERHLHRRAVAAPPPKRKVTLQELIQQLENMAQVMEDLDPRPKVRKARPHSKRQAVRAIAQLAHQENLSEIAAALEGFLDQYWDHFVEDLKWIDFEQLLQEWPNFQPSELKQGHPASPEAAVIHEKVGVFWGLLFLSAQSKVELFQEHFYQDLKVRNLKRAPIEPADSLPSFILPD